VTNAAEMDGHLDKSALRAAARERRRGANRQAGAALRDVLLTLPELQAASCVAAYVARSAEPDTAPILDSLAARGMRVLLPVLQADMDLDWAVDDGPRVHSTLTPSLVEPAGPSLGPDGIAQADVVLVPALTVDRSGVRLGYGGGCYDRALTRVRPDALLVALLHDGELTDDPLPVEPHDRRVHAVAMPSGLIRL
jgi:5-formyltetrahydrofolate cyclo-ligase